MGDPFAVTTFSRPWPSWPPASQTPNRCRKSFRNSTKSGRMTRWF